VGRIIKQEKGEILWISLLSEHFFCGARLLTE